ncbi:C6 zinc finger domain-containing protein [Penicillium malachiteum]|uniref:C6 zinc finger domain-containing protein n=1 Tax=Penicillium malachiteum TaxID=1324776 RepID=A0AAD6HJ60_9EURO|nr:C6 zinc finger domain-containing protein [Penicillium malachiteum]
MPIRARRVKCDEAKPQCLRCTSSGWNCEGYKDWLPVSLRRIRPSIIPGVNTMDLRSLDYFINQVTSVIAGPLPIWTHIVPQMAHQESSIRHAATAIGALYEEFRDDVAPASWNTKFALFHYNTAIQRIIHYPHESLDTVITVCVLFMTIEFLRANPDGAMLHYLHGRKILDSYKAPQHLIAIFSQLNVFVVFFTNICEIPSGNEPGSPSPRGPFDTLAQAQEALDWLTYRSMKVSFALDDDIRKFYDADTTKHVLLQKQNLVRDLESWLHAASLRLGHVTKKQRAIHRVLEARWLTCKIWINTGLECRITDESQDGTFKRIVDIALQIAGQDSETSSEVLAGAGFIPVLHFLAMKSRNMKIQLAGLLLFKRHCHLLNTMWDSKLLYLGAKRAIELDHGVVIKSDWPGDRST